jgi:hypothetical protein
MTAIEACPFRMVLAPPAGPVLEVRVTRPADLDWLRENLIPWFEPAAGRKPERVLSVRVSCEEHDRLIAVRGLGTRPANSFAFHGQADPTRVLLGEPAVVWDEDLRVFVRESPESPHFELVAAREQEATRVALLRILREIASEGLVAEQALPLHAAAVDWKGAGVLVAGPRRAGKTTCLLHLLRNPAVRFVANDRVFAQSEAGEFPILTGMPTIIGIRPESRELAGQGRFDHTLGWRARRTLQEVHTLPPETNPEESGGKLVLSSAQLLHCLGRQALARTKLQRILFPLTDPTRPGIQVRELAPDEVTRRLAANLFPLNGSARPDLVSEQLSCEWASILRMLARVPARELILGHRAVPSPELFGSWLDDLD